MGAVLNKLTLEDELHSRQLRPVNVCHVQLTSLAYSHARPAGEVRHSDLRHRTDRQCNADPDAYCHPTL